MDKHYQGIDGRDIEELDQKGRYYIRHVSAMTSEGLHSKADIAAELAYRDWKIDDLKEQLKKQAKAAQNGMDAARSASTQEKKKAQRLRDESKPELIDSERQANAQLTAQIEYLEQLAGDRLVELTDAADRITQLQTAVAEILEAHDKRDNTLLRGLALQEWADKWRPLNDMEADHGERL